MLHIAVGIGRSDFVTKLLSYMSDEQVLKQRASDGSTALHIVAIVGNKHAADLLVKKNSNLLEIEDSDAKTPLEKAYENKHLTTIGYLLKARKTGGKLRSQTSLVGSVDENDEIVVDLLVNVISAKKYSLASQLVEKLPNSASESDDVLMAIAKNFPSGLDYWEKLLYPPLDNIWSDNIWLLMQNAASFFKFLLTFLPSVISSGREEGGLLMSEPLHASKYNPIIHCIYELCFSNNVICVCAVSYILGWALAFIILLVYIVCFSFLLLYSLWWKGANLLASKIPPIRRIEKKKNEWDKAKKLLRQVCDEIDKSVYPGTRSHHPCYTRPILEAASQNAYKVVSEILKRSPEAIQSKEKKGYDIIQLAIIHRSEKIYNLIYENGERKNLYRTYEDSSMNNILHLTGKLAPSSVLNQRRGAALQLQRELQWLQSFSIAAALIATIVFAAAITVPGGTIQDRGYPVLRNREAFIIFAISDAISLFASSNALLVFLSILTARFAEKDFLVSLPRQLLNGLFSLLLSTTSMMVAFSAALFLVFCDGKLWRFALICGMALIPIAFFAALQLPLMVDLLKSTYSPIFGKQRKSVLRRFNQDDISLHFGK
ncbi:putative ankyrin repeat-containing domain, PGG domain, ankyrin repeat-containing domain superfamily [Helianthus annuus]|nr:putative ankyrin repeat-containing domain, PGG domain, ankyrin repeat-containing domain superfamily [Helianthus annuus]